MEKKVIMVVDDTPSNLQYAMEVLADLYKVVPVKSGEAALIALNKVVPDLILLDIEMPDMDGFETLRKLKADKRCETVPVIFLTSQSDAGSVKAVLDLKPQGYILKTTPSEIILDKIEDFFRKSM